jgi:hypothetical protein
MYVYDFSSLNNYFNIKINLWLKIYYMSKFDVCVFFILKKHVKKSVMNIMNAKYPLTLYLRI